MNEHKNWADRTDYEKRRAGLLFACIKARSTLRSLAVAQRHSDDPRLTAVELNARLTIIAARRQMAELRGINYDARFGSGKDGGYEPITARGATVAAQRSASPADREITPNGPLPCPMCGVVIGRAWQLDRHVRWECAVRQEKMQ